MAPPDVREPPRAGADAREGSTSAYALVLPDRRAIDNAGPPAATLRPASRARQRAAGGVRRDPTYSPAEGAPR